ncbi:hypothetical protein ACHHYP_04403 [Achlya hypogyna]|uniref:M96 mating-specific protein family n=1 Tax=Achlya hypogyna TaxID=1202772 RepID=A0A1V9Z1B7_ACHHY|nr:hypothetical protein ACHHYP_04403 [Achlya hypogyna]
MNPSLPPASGGAALQELEFLIATDAELEGQLVAMCDLLDTFASNSGPCDAGFSPTARSSPTSSASETSATSSRKRKADEPIEVRHKTTFQYRQRQEILQLRADVQALQARLRELQQAPQELVGGWATIAQQEMLAKLQALQENNHLRDQVASHMTFIESMSTFLRRKKPALEGTERSPVADWTSYKLAAQQSLRVAAIHAIADRQYGRQQTAFINAGIFDVPAADVFRTNLSIPADKSLLAELVMHRKYPAPFRVVANAFWCVVNGDAAPTIPDHAVRTIEKIDADTIYQTYRAQATDGTPVHLNLIYKQYDEPMRRIYVWRSVVEDALMPNMLSGALGIQWGWVVVQQSPTDPAACDFSFLRYINNGRGDQILEVIPRLDVFKFCREDLGDETIWKDRCANTMEVLMEQGKRWEYAFRLAIDNVVALYQSQTRRLPE